MHLLNEKFIGEESIVIILVDIVVFWLLSKSQQSVYPSVVFLTNAILFSC